MASSLTDIANLALTFLGEEPINNIETSNEKIAQQMRRWMDICIKEAQSTILWDELYTYNKPEFVTDSYAGVDGQYQYILPSDFLNVIEVNVVPPSNTTLPINQDTRYGINFNWKLQNGFLIARVENFEMFYARHEPSPAKWSVEMTEFIYHYLANKVAYAVTDNSSVVQFAESKFQEVKARVLVNSGNRSRRYKQKPRGFDIAMSRRSPSPRRI